MEQCILCATDATAPSPPLPISPCPSVGEGALRPLDAQLLGGKSWKDKACSLDSRTCGGFSGQRRLQAHEGDLGVAHGGRRTSSHRQGRLDFSVHADTTRGASSADVQERSMNLVHHSRPLGPLVLPQWTAVCLSYLKDLEVLATKKSETAKKNTNRPKHQPRHPNQKAKFRREGNQDSQRNARPKRPRKHSWNVLHFA